MPKSTFSVVIPLLNEQEAISELYARLTHELERMTEASDGNGFELIFIDDGSTDGTFRLLRELATVDSRVIAIRFRQRYGKTAALAAGFERARGTYTITMDGDLQHNPEDIPRFVEKLEGGMTSSAAGVKSGWTAYGFAASLPGS